jgi:FkbM family methyltransferase
MVADSSTRRETSLLHKARSFTELPGRGRAPVLLEELATAACASSPVPADRPLALYGAGDLGRLARDFLKAVGQDVVLAVDRNARDLAGSADWSGVRLVHPDDVATADKTGARLAVSVVTASYVPIERSLLDRGFSDVVPFYDMAESFRALHPLSNGWFAGPLTAEDEANTARVLANWHDDVSRAHHLQFLAWRRLREEWNFEPAPLPACSRFFIPEVATVLRGDEILLDAGAHCGNVTETFLQHTKGAFRQIHAIEPDSFNRARLAATLQRLLPGDGRANVYDCALADHEGEALFHDGLDYASQLSGTGRRKVATRTIDALGISPTFIKLHLEGAELATLKGASHTLLESRPLIVATVYHNDDGIWRTAAWLMEALTGYRYLFRNHSWCGTGSVIYAIPDERTA